MKGAGLENAQASNVLIVHLLNSSGVYFTDHQGIEICAYLIRISRSLRKVHCV